MEDNGQQVIETVYEVTTSGSLVQGPVTVLGSVSEEGQQHLIEIDNGETLEEEVEAEREINFTERDLLPYFKKAHIHTRAIADFLSTGVIRNPSMNNNKKNALRQAATMYRYVKGELFRHGSDREYSRFGLRIVVHDDEPQKRLDIITKGHIDSQGQHLGMNNTIKNVQQIYYWQGISSHVKMYLKRCTMCKTRSKFSAEQWFEGEKRNLGKKADQRISKEIRDEIRNLGRVKKATPPETFFIVNAQRNIDLDSMSEDAEMLIDSNNIEYVVETLGYSEDGIQLKEVCHVLNVGDIVPIPDRFRSREIENFVRHGTYPPDFSGNQRSGLRAPAAQYAIIDEELYHEYNKDGSKVYKLVIHDDQPALKVKIMVECHIDEDGNHLGLNRTMRKVCESYFWLGMSVDVKKFMLKCKVCTAPRERRYGDQSEKYMDEVLKLKEKDEMGAVAEQSESRPDEALLSLSEIIQQHEAQHAGSSSDMNEQVISLVGTDPSQKVTEITLNEEGAGTDAAEKVASGAAVAEAVAQIEASDEDKTAESATVSGVEVSNTATVDGAPENVCNTVEIPPLVPSGAQETVVKSLISYFKDMIYVPFQKKTRAIEAYLKSKTVYQGFTEARLEKLCMSYTLMNSGVLMRCASRYKAKQIVIHDDNPELKLKVIEEHHLKPNGDHCTELVTLQTILYKYYWEEARADVHRFYLHCSQCVQGGEEIRTRKKVISLEERAQKQISHRRMLRESGVSLERTKQYRKKYQDKFLEFKQRDESNRKEMAMLQNEVEGQVEVLQEAENVEVTEESAAGTGDESDIEIHLEDSEDEDSDISSNNDIALYKMTYLASRDEDEVIREEFQKNDWPYNQLNMQLVGEAKGNTDPGDSQNDLFRFSLLVTVEQQATLVGLLLLHEDDYTIEEYKIQSKVVDVKSAEIQQLETVSDSQPAPQTEAAPSQEKATYHVMQEVTRIQQSPNQETVVEIITSDNSQLGAQSSDSMVNVISEVTVTDKNTETSSESQMISLGPTVDSTSPVKAEVVSVAKETGSKDNAGEGAGHKVVMVHVHTQQKGGNNKKVVVVSDASRKTTVQEKPQSTPRGPKRKMQEVSTPVTSTPSPAGGRPRREIKRPRRYSPDREEQITPANTKHEANRLSSPVKAERSAETMKSPGRAQIKKSLQQSPASHGKSNMAAMATTPNTTKNVRASEPSRISTRSIRTKAQARTEVNEITKKDSESVIKIEQVSEQKVDNTNISTAGKSDNSKNLVVSPGTGSVDEQDDNDEEEMDEDEQDEIRTVSKKSFNPALEVLLTGGHQTMEVVRGDGGHFSCSLCDSVFTSEADCLKHGSTEKCLDECPLCGKIYRKNQLREYMHHMTMHEKGEKLECEICSKQFYDTDQARLHHRLHEEEKEVACTLCRQTFDTNFLLAVHMLQQHTRSDSFQCDVCNAKFVNISFMKCEVLFDGELSFFRCVMCYIPKSE